MQSPPPPPPMMPPPPPPAIPPQGPGGPGYGYTPQPAYGYSAQPAYGGFWIRLVAIFIDGLIVGIPLGIVGAVIGAVGYGASNGSNTAAAGITGLTLLWDLIAFAIEVGYFVYFWSTGSTIGMRIFRLRVVDATTGQPITMGRAGLRYLGYIVSVLPCYIGLIWAAFDARKQGWHDKIANTVVLQG